MERLTTRAYVYACVVLLFVQKWYLQYMYVIMITLHSWISSQPDILHIKYVARLQKNEVTFTHYIYTISYLYLFVVFEELCGL